jgi:hypothetical protein
MFGLVYDGSNEELSCIKTLKPLHIHHKFHICLFTNLPQLKSNNFQSFQTIESTYIPGFPLLIIFGSTIHTAKECYQVMFPKINSTIPPTFVNETSAINTILLKLIQCDELKVSEKDLLAPTNVFVLFKRPQPTDEHPELNELRNYKLPKSCKKFSINFRDSSEFEIFTNELEEEFQNVSINDLEEETFGDEIWFQSKHFVKGFKDVLVNNKSIWS